MCGQDATVCMPVVAGHIEHTIAVSDSVVVQSKTAHKHAKAYVRYAYKAVLSTFQKRV